MADAICSLRFSAKVAIYNLMKYLGTVQMATVPKTISGGKFPLWKNGSPIKTHILPFQKISTGFPHPFFSGQPP
ncbi:MAG: hypothetical protein IJY50_00285 [Clostridia bacterium]|nr:hypothetical protein [Clostridia bacterium]